MPLVTDKDATEDYQVDFSQVLKETEQVIRECLNKHKLDEVFLSFNGGKDCTVLLDVTINVIKKMLPASNIGEFLKVVYIRTENSFNELDEFVDQVQRHYGLDLSTTEGDLKTALQRILEEDKRLKACLMGTRRSDPFSANLDFMQKTDENWPQLLRVSPLLNWSYHQIWSYILKNKVPYCSLYDKGYTSIGSTANTLPNPALAIKSTGEKVTYLPAWQLADGSQERAGRGAKVSPNTFKPFACSNGHCSSNGEVSSSDSIIDNQCS